MMVNKRSPSDAYEIYSRRIHRKHKPFVLWFGIIVTASVVGARYLGLLPSY
jgi:hypothetical protein